MNKNEGITFNKKMVDINTLEVDGVDSKDYPDFCDAYFDFAEFTDGTVLTEGELVDFQNENLDLLGEMAFNSLY